MKPLFLIVEDDQDDRELLSQVSLEDESLCELRFAENGAQALEWLSTMPEKPSLLMIDLNLPRMNGIELLSKVKTSMEWRNIPVVVFSTCGSPDSIRKAYSLGANSYIVKPDSFQALTRVWSTFCRFWTETVQLPYSR